MTFGQNIRLGMVHVATTITFVPINGILNRVMIHEKGILASIIAALIIFPYLISPIQVWIGQFSDRHPIMGYRRTPYILGGILLCIVGLLLTPHTALMMETNFWQGLLLSIGAFGMWGVGNNLAAVSYLSLASDMSTENNRSKVISVMWVMMLIAIIGTAIIAGNALEPYSDAQLIRVFNTIGGISFLLLFLGLTGLEPRITKQESYDGEERVSYKTALVTVFRNPQARLFFIYLIMLLSALLGQDVLMEPYGAQAFGMTVKQTTQITATWGGMTMLALILQGVLFSKWITNKQGAMIGGALAAVGLVLVGISGLLHFRMFFMPGIALLGFGTGISTSTNLALMLGMTTPEQTGLFIGAWGVADALARGMGNLMGGVVRDVIAHMVNNTIIGYVSVFLIEAGMLGISLLMLRVINTDSLREEEQQSLSDILAMAGDV
jgi:BCD family chlorophyll transporter-like MFS transporter